MFAVWRAIECLRRTPALGSQLFAERFRKHSAGPQMVAIPDEAGNAAFLTTLGSA
jgi:hypothetical protein